MCFGHPEHSHEKSTPTKRVVEGLKEKMTTTKPDKKAPKKR